ncbi:alpha/beta fold hydrolase [Phenylobacterium sp.]|uniref:alpha/beta hydrolase family protein n=1 Tax=Phenylobacterium sp. TaxID=1871053 RepID=UPI0011F59D8C|nr:alpha/beta fold hydrolase [Phenylobacterium sp.]THD61497.1 MAG: alpha/beta fold hydrolase [Phenylobacterium sp.]
MRMMVGGLAAALVLGLAASARAEEAAGDWVGVLATAPYGDVTMALHLKKDGGGYSGALDDVTLGFMNLRLGNLAVSGDHIAMAIPAAQATYEATWDPAAQQWAGLWKSQGAEAGLPLRFSRGLPPPAPRVAGLDGDWAGAVEMTSGIKMHLALHVVTTEAAGTTAKLDVAEQGSVAQPVSSITRDGDKVTFEMRYVGVRFAGVLDANGRIAGAWRQAGTESPLILARSVSAATPTVLNRPQTPTKPYPYREEAVVFDNAAAHVRLAGTLTLPQGKGPFPVAVLISGSGPNTRNEPVLGHQIFLVLADHLTRNGIAVLRYDKRGVGESTGDYSKATTQDFADDAEAAVRYLAARPDIDKRHIGLIGHSEGGLIVPIVAARDPAVSFIVMMAGPGVNGTDVYVEQARRIFQAMGATPEAVAKAATQRMAMIRIIQTTKDSAEVSAKVAALFGPNIAPSLIKTAVDTYNTDWFREFFAYDPQPALRKVHCPVLALNGDKDVQVSSAQNLPAIRAALAANRDVEIDEIPGLNHLFQTAKTGGLDEYAQIEETVAPVALDKITFWVARHTGAKAAVAAATR